MKDVKLTDTGDIYLDATGNPVYVDTEPEYVKLKVGQALKVFLGEWFLDTTIGIPYEQNLFRKGADLRLIQTAIVEVISSVIGVKEIIFYEQYLVGRELNISFEIITDSGDVITAMETV